ncbi:hypothetical protein ASG87_03345 [Frateuria sp. Soil773]|nr:hypothetical protein ASG87_03345 [Frateuria sp. Soil773]
MTQGIVLLPFSVEVVVVLEHQLGSLEIMAMKYQHDVQIAGREIVARQAAVDVNGKCARKVRDVEERIVRVNQMPFRDCRLEASLESISALEAVCRQFFAGKVGQTPCVESIDLSEPSEIKIDLSIGEIDRASDAMLDVRNVAIKQAVLRDAVFNPSQV